MATWPTSLPVPLVNGYTLSPVDQTVRTDMESGAARVRRRTVARNDQVDVAWLLGDAQMATLRAWFDDAVAGIAGGSAWFYITLALGGATIHETKEARFVGPFSAARTGRHWRVTAKLEVR